VTSSRYGVFFVLGPLLGFSWLLVLVLHPERMGGRFEYAAIGYLFGTLFGQALLASAWIALGPFWLPLRLALSLGWIAALWLSVIVALDNGPGLDFALLLGACLLGLWLVVQVPFWGLALYYGIRLSHRSAVTLQTTNRQRQFGIRELMVLTAAVAIMLGAGRALLLWLAERIGNDISREAPVFIFLAAAAIALGLPLLLAALLPRWASLAVPAVLVLIATATWWELPLVALVQGPGGGPDYWHLAWINFFTALWALLVVVILRLGGYGLATAELRV
jgi:hypothetical protein